MDTSQREQTTAMPLIGDKAPSFRAITTQGELYFPEDLFGSWVIFFSHPADFTPVCTSEFMTLAAMSNEFREINAELLGLSIDSIYSHIAWLRKIKEMVWKDIKHAEITFPVIADASMEIAKKYGMIHPQYSTTQTVRSVFIIDPTGVIRTILYYPASTGRNLQEIKRILISLQLVDREGVATPAGWMPQEDVILPPPSTCNTAKERVARVEENQYCLDWFMCFKQAGTDPSKSYPEPETLPYPSAVQDRRHYRNPR